MELKPCPFCGGEGDIRKDVVYMPPYESPIEKDIYYIQCKKCLSLGPCEFNPREAEISWSRRMEKDNKNSAENIPFAEMLESGIEMMVEHGAVNATLYCGADMREESCDIR